MGDGVHRLPDGHGKLDRHGRVQAGCTAVLEDVLEMWTEKMVLQLYRRTESETKVSALRVRGEDHWCGRKV